MNTTTLEKLPDGFVTIPLTIGVSPYSMKQKNGFACYHKDWSSDEGYFFGKTVEEAEAKCLRYLNQQKEG